MAANPWTSWNDKMTDKWEKNIREVYLNNQVTVRTSHRITEVRLVKPRIRELPIGRWTREKISFWKKFTYSLTRLSISLWLVILVSVTVISVFIDSDWELFYVLLNKSGSQSQFRYANWSEITWIMSNFRTTINNIFYRSYRSLGKSKNFDSKPNFRWKHF